MKKLKVNAGKGYDILIEKNLIKDCGKYIVAVTRARKTAIVTDSNVAPLYLEAVEKSLKSRDLRLFLIFLKQARSQKQQKLLLKLLNFLRKMSSQEMIWLLPSEEEFAEIWQALPPQLI